MWNAYWHRESWNLRAHSPSWFVRSEFVKDGNIVFDKANRVSVLFGPKW